MKKQTAVEWLEGENAMNGYIDKEIFEQAKQMDQKQFKTSYTAGQINALQYINKDIPQMDSAEKYYQEIYGDQA